MSLAAAFSPPKLDVPPMFAHQLESVQFYRDNPGVFNTSDPGCVSADTEYLTPTGWKRIDQYTNGPVAQFHPDTKTIEFVEPIEYVKRPCQTMISIAPSRGTSQRLSHEHRVLLYSKDRPNEWKVVSAQEFTDEFYAYTNAASFRFAFACTFNAPNDRTGIPLTNDQLRLQVAVIADGHLNTASTARVTVRLKKLRKIQRLRTLLQAAGVEFKHRHCNSAPGFEVFTFYAPTADKHFTADFWWDATPAQLGIIADEARHWDGSEDRRNGHGSVRITSYTRADTEFLQYAFAASGWTTSRSDHTRKRRNKDETAYELRAYLNGGLVGPGRKTSVTEDLNPEGFKYCFEVPSNFLLLRHNGYIFATGNTGKTRAWLEWFREHREEGGGKGLVLCPKSIMRAAWLNDAARWTPELRVSVATAENRREGLNADADLVIVNHDAVRAMAKDRSLLPKGFDTFNIDESGAYKSPNSMRSKAARKLLEPFEFRTAMNGTPAPNGPLDLFHQMLLVDRGERLGENFYAYRARTCEPEKVAPHLPHVNWMPRPGIMEALADLIEDVTIRFKLEDVIDMPDRVVQTLNFVPSAKHLKAYEELRKHQLTVTDTGESVNAIHAAALRTKLLQCMSGAAYDDSHYAVTFDSARYELIGDLVEARAATLVGFQYRHTREALEQEFTKRKIKYGVIDGSVTSMDARTEIVRRFEHGDLQCVLAHPQSAGHGLTLVRANAVIWASPTDRSDLWTQFNARIFRAGQKKRTEIIRICAAGTVEEKAYDQLTRKVSNEEALLELLT